MANILTTTLLTAVLGALIFTGALYSVNNTSDLKIPQHVVNSFTAFKNTHNKVYASQAEHNFRLATFHAHFVDAQEHNAKNLRSRRGVTKFSDLTKEEFKAQYLGYKPSTAARNAPKKTFSGVRATSNDDKDWRDSNAVTPVKDQGQCGSCWAFSATQAIETGFWKNSPTNEQRILAPQQIVSCDTSDLGCNGGNTSPAYDYVESAGGIALEENYPYTSGSGDDGYCTDSSTEKSVKVTGYQTISNNESEETKMYDQIQESPMSVCVDAESWQNYTGGVVDASTCGTDLDHCVHLVGMQDQAWIVKNSWGTFWGEDGYIRVQTGENACGITSDVSIVTAEDATSPF